MMRLRIQPRPALLLLAGCLLSTAVAAQTVESPKVVISNAGTAIPLQQDQPVQFLDNGDLSIACRLDQQSRCPGLGSGTGAPATFTLSSSTTSLNSGSPITLNWNSTDSLVCYGDAIARTVGTVSEPAAISGWSGRELPKNGSAQVTLTAAGPVDPSVYVFDIRCFSAGGNRVVSSAAITVIPTTQPTAFCAEYIDEVYGGVVPTEQNFIAWGFTKVEATMQTIWGVNPGDSAPERIVPGNTLNPSAGKYLAIPFSVSNNQQFILDWVESQTSVASRAVQVTISPCPGDFRAPNNTSPDLYLRNLCRVGSLAQGSITATNVSNLSGCKFPTDKLMYINISTANMFGATRPDEAVCGRNNSNQAINACGVAMQIR